MRRRSYGIALCLTPVILLLCYITLYQHYHYRDLDALQRAEEDEWLRTSPSWGQRQRCAWFGFCGAGAWEGSHSAQPHPHGGKILEGEAQDDYMIHPFWMSGEEDDTQWSEWERQKRKIPDYVLEYAPLVHLFSGEEFWPSDIAEHLLHVKPYDNYTLIKDGLERENISTLRHLNRYGGRHVFLTSDDDVESRPHWLTSRHNIPVKVNRTDDEDTESRHDPGRVSTSPFDQPYDLGAENSDWMVVGDGTPLREGPHGDDMPEDTDPEFPSLPLKDLQRIVRRSHRKNKDDDDLRRPPFPVPKPPRRGRSGAPAVLIISEKGDGVLDAFWFFFYSYNLGNKVLNVRFGNHVGDWEHTAVRFQHGEPKAVFVSEHEWGDAYVYEAMEKIGTRPVVYSGTGTHAMYVTPGLQPYILPWGILHDETDRGPLWDPVLNLRSYTLDYKKMLFRSSNLNPQAPTSWLNYFGRWGDKAYPLTDHRQYRFAGQAHYVSGPTGPRFKNLGRQWVCQGRRVCRIKKVRGNPNSRPWTGEGPGMEMSTETIRHLFETGQSTEPNEV